MSRSLTKDAPRLILPLFVALFVGGNLLAQSKDWPFSQTAATRSPTPPVRSTPPPLSAPLRQETWAQLSEKTISPTGAAALALNPRQWYHGETENFVLHYRNFSDALEVARQIEFDLWYVANSLGATKEKYSRKSHVYALGDEKEWHDFLAQRHSPSWIHSFALGDDLFLNIHGTGSGFDAQTLAHETTHAVVSRIYRNQRWPLWLSEGFAEYMGDACIAARRQQPIDSNPRNLRLADLTLTQLFAQTNYPEDYAEITPLYQTSAKFVRYLFQKYPAERFPKFVDRILAGATPPAALVEIYGDEFRDMAAFEKRFETMVR